MEFVETRLLLDATSKGSKDQFNKLMSTAKGSRTSDRLGENPLHKAVASGRVDIVRLLIDNWGANVNEETMDKKSAIDIAIEDRNEIMVRILLKKGAHVREETKASLRSEEHDGADHPRDWAREKIKRIITVEKPILAGPSAGRKHYTIRNLARPRPECERVCSYFKAQITEFLLYKSTTSEARIFETPSVHELLHTERPLDEILHQNFELPSGFQKSSICKWYHLPANNVSQCVSRLYNSLVIDKTL